eukprot:3729048-Rhodomonas_salina.1
MSMSVSVCLSASASVSVSVSAYLHCAPQIGEGCAVLSRLFHHPCTSKVQVTTRSGPSVRKLPGLALDFAASSLDCRVCLGSRV